MTNDGVVNTADGRVSGTGRIVKLTTAEKLERKIARHTSRTMLTLAAGYPPKSRKPAAPAARVAWVTEQFFTRPGVVDKVVRDWSMLIRFTRRALIVDTTDQDVMIEAIARGLHERAKVIGRVLPWKRLTVAQRAVLRCEALKVLDLLEQLARRTKR